MSRYVDADRLEADLIGNRYGTQAIKYVIDQHPTVDVEPVRHGHWVHGKELSRDYIGDVCVSIHYDKCCCSECDYQVKGYPLWLYCPNCGAKMDEVEE